MLLRRTISFAATLIVGATATFAWAQNELPPGNTAPQPAAAPAGQPAASAAGQQEFIQKLSYALGREIGNSFRDDKVPVDLNLLMAGVNDALTQAAPRWSNEELAATMQQFEQLMQKREAQRQMTAAQKNTKVGADFLAMNGQAEGVQTTASGLQYKVLTAGTGPSPTVRDTVRCHYRGTFINGREFDSSYSRGEPAEFPVGGVIKGWTEALQMMKVGDKYQLFIPSELAYGERGAGGAIGPNETLIFEVELLGIVR